MKAGAEGGIEAIVKAINIHINNSDVCRRGCSALWNLAHSRGKNIDKNKQTKEMKLTVNKYLFFTFVGSTILMELMQFLFYGESIAFFGADLLFMSFVGLLLCCWRLILILSLLAIFEVTETISFMITGNGLDFQILNNADVSIVGQGISNMCL